MLGSGSKKPILSVLQGRAVEPRPVWLMRQAGRFLPEYRKLRASVPDFLTLCFTPKLATEVTLQPIRRFAFDAAILFSDILVIPHALGQRVWFAEGEGPRLEPLDEGSIGKLDLSRVVRELNPVLETVANLRATLPAETTLIGFAGAPWTVATYMIAGRGSEDSAAARAFAAQHPAAFAQLIETLVTATSDYLIAQIDAGAEAIQLFESWASTVPSGKLEAFSLNPLRQIIDRVRAKHPQTPVIVFPRGSGANYLRYGEIGANAVSIDYESDIAAMRKAFSASTALQGNLDPATLIAGGEALRSTTAKILTDLKGTPHIFNLGHGVRPETPVEHVEALVRQIRVAA